MANYDVLGNIAVVKFHDKISQKEKRLKAEKILKIHKSVKTVVEKIGEFKGRLRTHKIRHLCGEKNKEVLYRENSCEFRFNVESCYFSSRLSSERLEIAKKVKKGEEILVMFGGVAPFSIVIAKHSKGKRIVSVDLGRSCSKYAVENVKRNKINNVEIIPGDVRRKLKNSRDKFDRIVMARPNLRDPFLNVALSLIKKNGIIHYYGFCHEDDLVDLKKGILEEAKKARKKIKIIKVKKAGEIAPFKWRWRLDLKIN